MGRTNKRLAKTVSADNELKTPSPKKHKRSRTPSTKAKKSPAATERTHLLRRDVSLVSPDSPYLDLQVQPSELRPSATLTTGQCFHWKVVEEDDTPQSASAWGTHDATEWVGIIRLPGGESVVVAIKEEPATTLYRVLAGPENLDYPQILSDYFQLQHKLEPLYKQWSKDDPGRLAQIADCIQGVRIVEQDPWECLVSFICSSNNNIPRITKMLSAIRKQYGKPLITIGDETLYSFPSLQDLSASATDEDLREVCGMGYRAKYLLETIKTLQSLGGESYLVDLRSISDPIEVQEKLIQFCGVGRKVADCVALFSLRQANAIPVDVHVWNIARRDYDAENQLTEVKSMTPTVYKATGDLFRSRFEVKPGWAHSLLFVAELPSFRPVLPAHVVEEMDNFRQFEQERKAAAKKTKKGSPSKTSK